MTSQDWSVPETEVIRSIRELLETDRQAVVATIVGVEGSAYRRPGAKMVITEDGDGLGHITAGCLEDEVIELTARVLEAGTPRIETYDLMEDDDDVWGLGIGCNGVIDVLLDPLDESYSPVVDAFEADDPVAIVTVLESGRDLDVPTGARAYYRDGSLETSEAFPAELTDAVEDAAATLLVDGGSDSVTIEGADERIEAEVFIDTIEPAPELVVFGSGHDVGPVVELASNVDFRVRVVGFRGAVDLGERFPDADAVETLGPGRIRSALDLDEDTYCVVMSHNFVDDRLTVDELLRSDVPYVGLMGPRDRFEEMLDEFDAEGRTFEDTELERLYTPVGLDLGSGTPYGIAHSIVGEALAVRNSRTPQHLKDREGPIHDRTDLATVESSPAADQD